jgi:hypothetical protein
VFFKFRILRLRPLLKLTSKDLTPLLLNLRVFGVQLLHGGNPTLDVVCHLLRERGICLL